MWRCGVCGEGRGRFIFFLKNNNYFFHPDVAGGNGWTQTLDLRIMRFLNFTICPYTHTSNTSSLHYKRFIMFYFGNFI